MQRTLTLNERQIDDFTWLEDIDPGYGDLLVVRIGREGKIDKPFVLLDCTINQNTARYSDMVLSHAGVDIGLIKGRRGGIHLFQKHCGLFSSDHQFCAILPLQPKEYEYQRQRSNKSSIFEPLEELFDLEGLYRIFDLECVSRDDCKKPQMKDPSNEASDEEKNIKSYQEGCDKSTSNDKANTGNGHDNSSDGVGREKEKGEGQKEEEDESDNDGEDDDDDEPDTAEDEFDIQEKWNQLLDDIQKAWKCHKWPDEKRQIRTFARIAVRLQQAQKKAYNVEDGKIYRHQVGEVPRDWMTLVKEFGESFFHVKRTEKRSSFSKESADDQSINNSDAEQTLGGSGDEGTKGFTHSGSKVKPSGVK